MSSCHGPGKADEMVPLHGCLGLSFHYRAGFFPSPWSLKQAAFSSSEPMGAVLTAASVGRRLAEGFNFCEQSHTLKVMVVV